MDKDLRAEFNGCALAWKDERSTKGHTDKANALFLVNNNNNNNDNSSSSISISVAWLIIVVVVVVDVALLIIYIVIAALSYDKQFLI